MACARGACVSAKTARDVSPSETARATIDEVVGVEENNPEKSGEGDDGHVASVGLCAPSGQVSTFEGPVGTASDGVNGAAAAGYETSVPAALTMRLAASLPSRVDARVDAGDARTAARARSAHGPRDPAAPGVRSGSHPVEDEGLLRRAATGDPAAFREIFLRHRADVARLVFRMLHAPSDLEDVVQEVFVQVYRSLKDFRGQSKFSTWLHRVTVNVVLMHRRSARSRPVLAEEAPSDFVADERQPLPDEDAERCERMRAFQRLLGRLADKKRIVFVLHELEGMSPSEIAEIVAAPVLTVRTRLFYARRELEEMLGEEPTLAGLGLSPSPRDADPPEATRDAHRATKKDPR